MPDRTDSAPFSTAERFAETGCNSLTDQGPVRSYSASSCSPACPASGPQCQQALPVLSTASKPDSAASSSGAFSSLPAGSFQVSSARLCSMPSETVSSGCNSLPVQGPDLFHTFAPGLSKTPPCTPPAEPCQPSSLPALLGLAKPVSSLAFLQEPLHASDGLSAASSPLRPCQCCGRFPLAPSWGLRELQHSHRPCLAHPLGVPWATPAQKRKLRDGNSFVRWTARLVRLAEQCGLYYLFEASRLATKLRAASLDGLPSGLLRLWDSLAQSRFRTNTLLAGQRTRCRCTQAHRVLRGRCKAARANWTKLAEAYPLGLCQHLAEQVSLVVRKPLRQAKLNVAGCSRCCSLRPGEASVPGPRPL